MNTDLTRELFFVNRFRETMYSFSSRLFSRELDVDFWFGIADVLSILDRLGDLSDCPGGRDIPAACRELSGFIENVDDGDLENVLLSTARQYARLFLGVGTETVSLCESSFTGPTGGLYSEAYFSVQQEYRSAGLAKAGNFTEPDDHLAVELGFMAWSIRKVNDCLTEGESTRRDSLIVQRGFLVNHLLNWVPELTLKIEGAAPGLFYASAGRLLTGFLRLDLELIDFLTDDRTGRAGTIAGQTPVKRP